MDREGDQHRDPKRPYAGHHDRLLVCWWARPLLTIHPADADTLEDGHKEKAHPAGSVGVEELEDVHTALQSRRTGMWTRGCKDTWDHRSALGLPSAQAHFHQSRRLLPSLPKQHSLCTWAPRR